MLIHVSPNRFQWGRGLARRWRTFLVSLIEHEHPASITTRAAAVQGMALVITKVYSKYARRSVSIREHIPR